MASPGIPELKPRRSMGRGLSSGRPARTQVPSEETGERTIQRVTESTGSYADPASPSAGFSPRESETKETAQLFRSPLKYQGFFPSPDTIAHTLTFRGGCDIGRTDGEIVADRLGYSKDSARKGNSSQQKHPGTMPRQLFRLEVLCCDQATVAMRPCAGLAGVELALLSRGGTTCGTSDSEYLLRGEFFFHSRGRILQALWPSLHASAPFRGFRRKRFSRSGSERGRANQTPQTVRRRASSGLDVARSARHCSSDEKVSATA
jgi:hypothetical protein